MNKFLWFLGGCATGLLAAAAISVLNESCGSSSPSDDDEGVELDNEDTSSEEAPIFPEGHFQGFKTASAVFANACGHVGSDEEQATHHAPVCTDTPTA